MTLKKSQSSDPEADTLVLGLVYSTYLGGTDLDLPRDIKVDDSGNAYVVGATLSTDFPLVSPLRNQSSGGEGFLTRFNSAGNQLLYSTYIGGLRHGDQVGGLALGDAGIVYLVGHTASDDIPVVLPPEPLDSQPADLRLQQGPVLQLKLLTATRNGRDLDLFITVLDPSNNSVSLSGYLGGSSEELSGRIALDDSGYVHVTGKTRSSDYPVYNPIQGQLPGQEGGGFQNATHSGIVSALDPETTNARYSTYLSSGARGEYANDLTTTNSSVLVTGRSSGGFKGFRSNLPLANPFSRGRFNDRDAYATKLMFSRGQFLGPFAGQDWSRFVRVDTHANGVPDPLDEILSVYRNGSDISFSSARWSEALLKFSNTNSGNGEFETVTRTKVMSRGTLTTTASVTGRDSGRVTSISMDEERDRVTSGKTNKSGQVALIDANEDGIYDAFRGQGDGYPEVTVSLVLVDSDGDGTADFVTIPWVMAHLVGVNRADRLPDPQVFVPLGDTDGDTIPDTVAFDFDVDNVADADLPKLAKMAGPGSDPEYKLHFAHFGDGAGLLFSQIILFTLDPLSAANVTITIRGDDGQLLSIDLNGTVVNGQLQAVIPACGIRSFKTDSQGPVQAGSVTVSSDKPVAGVLLFGGSIGLAGVGSSQEMGNGFLAPMETNAAAGIRTGLAVKNLELSALTLTFRLQEHIAGAGEGFGGDDGPALEALFKFPRGLVIDSADNIFVSDTENFRIRKIDAQTGIVTTVAGREGTLGDGGRAPNAVLEHPVDVQFDNSGNLFISDHLDFRIRRVDVNQQITTVPSTQGMEVARMTLDPQGDLIVSAGRWVIARVDLLSGEWSPLAGGGAPNCFTEDGEIAFGASLAYLGGLAYDRDGNLYFGAIPPPNQPCEAAGRTVITDRHSRVRRIDAVTGRLSTVVGTGVVGFEGDGGPATQARINDPAEIVFDSIGNLLILDAGNARVRRVDVGSGVITTIAGGGSEPISDGLQSTEIVLPGLRGMAIDEDDTIYLSLRPLILRIDPKARQIFVVAGTGQVGVGGDGGPALEAELNFPFGMIFDGSRNLFLVDNQRVRAIKGPIP